MTLGEKDRRPGRKLEAGEQAAELAVAPDETAVCPRASPLLSLCLWG